MINPNPAFCPLELLENGKEYLKILSANLQPKPEIRHFFTHHDTLFDFQTKGR